ncbi:unnamed protein product [Cylindrotheca closterium]|uniref:G-protein coupled receptors family 1 profile domain-containing protein n=1 Tax=Cylindrotheca closterium TaxID=2856 RepID=A0AAD2PVW2_9STRA|nr:unnamed protein product [Cylindrotheca closterium]
MSSDDELLDIQVREWELGPNNTVFDNLKAAPSDEILHIQWMLYITLLAIAAVFMASVFCAILLDKKCRRNSFNTYLLYLTAPDLAFTASCIITCSLNVSTGAFYSDASCTYQSFYCVFAIASSSWLNAILAWQLHKMLYCSNRAIRYHPPTRFRVSVQSLSVYAWSGFVASWAAWGADWWPIRNGLYSGVLCLPMPYDQTSVIFFYSVFAPCVFVIPLLYISYITFDTLRHRLLPPLKQRKTLMIFFRLVLIYFVFWLPAILITFVGSNWLSSWWGFTGGAWAHLQGAASAAVCLVKPDVWDACRRLISFKGDTPDTTAPENTGKLGSLDNFRSDSFLGIHEGDDDDEEEEEARTEQFSSAVSAREVNNATVDSVTKAFELVEEGNS